MQVVTIQHKKVLESLENTGVYQAEMSRVPDNRKQAYQDMCEYYGWDHCPVFGCELGHELHLDDGRCEDGVALQLEVPDMYARRQHYYDWSDVIYFLEFPNEFNDTFDLTKVPDIKTYEKFVFDFIYLGSYDIVQVTMPFLKKEWITAVSYNPLAVVEQSRHDDVLRSLCEYDESAVVFDHAVELSKKTDIFIKE